MSSAVNKIKDALHLGNNDEHETGQNQSGIQHLGNSRDSDPNSGLNSAQYNKAGTATGHDTFSGTSTNIGNEKLTGTILDKPIGHILNPGDTRDSYDETTVNQYPSSQYAKQSHGNLGNKTSNTLHASNAQPHESGYLNKIDPRVEHDSRDSRKNYGRTPGGTSSAFDDGSTTRLGNESQNSGLFNSGLADKMDPTIHTNRHQSHDVDGSSKYLQFLEKK